MKILVIGGAGYIGAHVNRALLDAGHTTQVFDNFYSGQRENLFAESPLIEGDVLDYPFLVKSLRGFDTVIHLAAYKGVGESMIKPEMYATNNISGTINILNAMCETGAKNIIFSSSAAVFGQPEYTPVDEDHPKNPTSFYGYTKLDIERYFDWYDRLKGIRSASLRYFNAAGYDAKGHIKGLEKNAANLLPAIMEAAFNLRPQLEIFGDDYDTRDGTCVRDYVHVSDLAVAHVKALEYVVKNDKSLKVNLGSEKGVTVKELFAACVRILGKEIPYKVSGRRAGDPATLVASGALAKSLLNWTPTQSSVDELITSTFDAYKREYPGRFQI